MKWMHTIWKDMWKKQKKQRKIKVSLTHKIPQNPKWVVDTIEKRKTKKLLLSLSGYPNGQKC
jgi:hypothetical protein